MRAIITSLLVCLSIVYANAQSPAIAYADIAHGNFGGTYAATASGSNFFAAEVISETGNRLIRIKKYNADGAFLTTNIFSDGCQTCNASGQIPVQLFPASDGGAFLYYELTNNTPVLKKIAPAGNVAWTRTYTNLKFTKATPTIGNGLFVIFRVTSGININRYFVYNLATDGSTNWTRDLANSLPTDIAATPDSGIIIADADSTKRMSNAGSRLWSVNRGSNLVKVVDSDFGYQADGNRVIRFSLSNGNIDFVRNQAGVNDLLVTPDKAVVFSTNDRIQKLSTSGNNVFQNNIGSQRLVLAANGNIGSVGTGTSSNRITILNENGTLQWQKSLTYNLGQSVTVHPSSDNGWFATTRGQVPARPSAFGTGFLYRFNAASAGCNFSVSISPNTRQFICKTGSISFEVTQSNLDLSFGLPSTDYTIQWLRNNQVVSTNTLTYAVTQNGDYSARITQGSCVNNSVNVPIEVLGNTAPIVTSDINELCLGGGASVTLTAAGCPSGSITSWSNNQTGSTISVSPATTTDYTAQCITNYTENNVAKTCVGVVSVSRRITVRAISDLTIPNGITGSSAICKDAAEQLSVAVSGNAIAPLTYSWTRNNAAVSALPTITTVAAGSYQVNVRDRRGCTVQSPVKTLQVLGNTIPTISSDIDQLCLDGGARVSLTSAGCLTAANTLWSNSVTGAAINVSPTITTDYTAQCVDTYLKNGVSQSCVGLSSPIKKITVLTTSNLSITAGIRSANAICQGTPEPLSFTLSGDATAPLTYAWTRNGNSISTDSIFRASVAGTYRVSVKDKRGCTAQSAVKELKLLGNETPAVTASIAEICRGGGVQPLLSATGCTSAAYAWGTTSATTPTITVSPTTTTNYNVRCSDTFLAADNTAKTCLSTVPFQQTINVRQQSNIEVIDLFVPDVFCKNDGQAVVRTDSRNAVGPATLEWFRNGVSISTALDIIVSDPGDYQVKIRDARGCTAESAVKKVERSNLAVSLTGSRQFCEGTNTVLQASATQGLGASTFEWRLGSQVVSSATSLTIDTPGNYSVRATDSKGCVETVEVPVTNLPKIVAGFNKTATVKGNLLYNFNPDLLSGGTKPFAVTLTATSASNNPITVSQNSVGRFTENGTVFVNVKDANGCEFSDNIQINYVPCNVAATISGDTTFCFYDRVVLRANQSSGIAPFVYSWTVADATIQNETQPIINTRISGIYRVNVRDSANCTFTSPGYPIRDRGRDIISFIRANGDSTAFFPFAVELNATTQSGVTYQWFRNDTLVIDQITPVFRANQTGVYNVRASKDGCAVNSNTIRVTILIPLASEPTVFGSEVLAFPNPTSEEFVVKMTTQTPLKATCEIVDMRGRGVYSETKRTAASDHEWKVNASKWAAGTYIYRITTANGEASGKIIKR